MRRLVRALLTWARSLLLLPVVALVLFLPWVSLPFLDCLGVLDRRPSKAAAPRRLTRRDRLDLELLVNAVVYLALLIALSSRG